MSAVRRPPAIDPKRRGSVLSDAGSTAGTPASVAPSTLSVPRSSVAATGGLRSGAGAHAPEHSKPHLVTRDELEGLIHEARHASQPYRSLTALRHACAATSRAAAPQAVRAVVGEGVFLPHKLTGWTGNIVVRCRAAGPSVRRLLPRHSSAHALCRKQEGVLKRLAALNKPLKYIGAL